jgi:hypothetical protein
MNHTSKISTSETCPVGGDNSKGTGYDIYESWCSKYAFSAVRCGLGLTILEGFQRK